MSRFGMLYFNSDSDEEEVIVENQLTPANLLKVGVVSDVLHMGEVKRSDNLLETARLLIYDMMKGYARITPLKDMEFNRAYMFTNYMSVKTRSFFTELFCENDGSWDGELASIHTWRYGKNPDGSQIFLYISTCEIYGTCSGCDRTEGVKDTYYEFFHDIRYNMEKIAIINGTLKQSESCYVRHDTPLSISTDGENKITIFNLKKEINAKMIAVRELLSEHILYTVQRLVVSRTYNDAVAHVNRKGNFSPPKFLYALKAAFPDKDFSHMEPSKIPKQRKHVLGNYLKNFKK